MTTRAQTARKLASQMWGDVQEQKKMCDGIWWFTTERHGGYIVDTEVRKELQSHNVLVLQRKGGHYGLISEQGFAPFEEDCDAALIDYLYAEEMQKALQQLYQDDFGDIIPIEMRVEDVKAQAKERLERWHPDWLRKYDIEHPSGIRNISTLQKEVVA